MREERRTEGSGLKNISNKARVTGKLEGVEKDRERGASFGDAGKKAGQARDRRDRL